MNNSKTPKIVVGVALGAVYATGLAVILARGANDPVVAANASVAPAMEVAPDPFATADVIDPTSSVESTTGMSDAIEPPSAGTATAAIAAPPAARETMKATEEEAAASVADGRVQVETSGAVEVDSNSTDSDVEDASTVDTGMEGAAEPETEGDAEDVAGSTSEIDE